MSIKDNFNVYSIPTKQAKPWILKKHYAGRMPSVSYAFGLYDKENNIKGICTFGKTPNYMEDKRWEPYECYELNRFITEDDLPYNTASYFISQCIKKMPTPLVLLSYADLDKGHHGYIYQASNWIYVGKWAKNSSEKYKLKNGKIVHRRHKDKLNKEDIEEIIYPEKGKAKYYYFHGNKRDKKKMLKILKNDKDLEKKPYPKGDNKEYDASGKILNQLRLFQK